MVSEEGLTVALGIFAFDVLAVLAGVLFSRSTLFFKINVCNAEPAIGSNICSKPFSFLTTLVLPELPNILVNPAIPSPAAPAGRATYLSKKSFNSS